MSATTVAPMTLDVSGTARTPFLRLVQVELRKSWDTRASLWLLISIGVLVVAVEAIVLAVTVVQDEPLSFGDTTAVAAFVTSILLPVLGIMLVTAEWGQRTAMVTFALEPRRSLVIAAKALVGVILTLATVLLSVAVGLVTILLYAGLQGESPVWSFGISGLLAFVVTQLFAMFGGFALATLFLNTPVAIVTFFVYRWVLPGLIALGTALMDWFGSLAPWIDFQSAQGELYDPPLTGDQWAQLLVSGIIWLVIPVVVGVWRILHAEVK
jgi:ABC-2 type transport system permease protein